MHDKKLTTETNAPPSRAISMAVTMRRCDAKRITRCSMFRATLEATGHHHWASICPILFCWMPWSSIFGLKNQNRNNSIHRTYDTIISKMALNLLGFGRVFYGSCCLRDTRPAFCRNHEANFKTSHFVHKRTIVNPPMVQKICKNQQN